MSTNNNEVYIEKLHWKLGISKIVIAVAPVFLILLGVISESISDRIGLISGGICFLVFIILFRELQILITPEKLEVSYSIFKKVILLNKIKNVCIHKYKFREFLGWV